MVINNLDKLTVFSSFIEVVREAMIEYIEMAYEGMSDSEAENNPLRRQIENFDKKIFLSNIPNEIQTHIRMGLTVFALNKEGKFDIFFRTYQKDRYILDSFNQYTQLATNNISYKDGYMSLYDNESFSRLCTIIKFMDIDDFIFDKIKDKVNWEELNQEYQALKTWMEDFYKEPKYIVVNDFILKCNLCKFLDIIKADDKDDETMFVINFEAGNWCGESCQLGFRTETFLKELKCKKESLYTISKFISTFEEFFDNVCDETDIKDYMEYNIRMKYEDEMREMNYFFDKGVEINSELKKMMLFIEKNNDVCSYHESR